MSTTERLDARYGRGPRKGRRLVLIYAGVVLLFFLAWFGWALWNAMNPAVSSQQQNWRAVDANTVEVTYQVNLHDEGAGPITCSVRAEDANAQKVGELIDFETEPGRYTIEFDTERTALRLKWEGCTTPGQDTPK